MHLHDDAPSDPESDTTDLTQLSNTESEAEIELSPYEATPLGLLGLCGGRGDLDLPCSSMNFHGICPVPGQVALPFA